MRILAISLSALALASTGASAQTTGPQIDFGLLGKPPDLAGDYMNGYEQGQRIAARRAAEQRAQAEADRENQERAAAWQNEEDQKMRATNAGQLIAAGHCEQARNDALNSGDLDLAAHVAALCPVPRAK